MVSASGDNKETANTLDQRKFGVTSVRKVSEILVKYLFKYGQPSRDQVQVFQAKPLSVARTFSNKLHGNVCLTLSHSNLQKHLQI